MRNKIVYFLFLFAILIPLSGCGKEKVLSCKQQNDIMSTEILTTFQKDDLKSMQVIYSYDISSYSDVNIEEIKKQDYCKTIEESDNDYKDSFKDCNQKISDNKVIVTTNIDVETQKSNGVNSYENLKKEMETAGAVCEEK